MKKGKGKAAKKAMKFAERRIKAEKWVAAYDGTPYGGDIVKAYRKKFAVDRMKAVEELQLLGVSLTKEQIDREKAAVKAYQEIQRAQKAKRKRIRTFFRIPGRLFIKPAQFITRLYFRIKYLVIDTLNL